MRTQSGLTEPLPSNHDALSDGAYFDIRPACDTGCPLIFLCDHASNFIPERYQHLGLDADQLNRHIAFDIGAAGTTLALANHFGATAVLSRFSRLLIDPNRGPDDPTLFMRIADGAVVPGNRFLDDKEMRLRMDTFYEPYHRAVAGEVERVAARGVSPVVISVHSFTEAWKGVPRPWQVGILWDKDGRIAKPLISALRADTNLVVGDNEPYSGELEGDTMWRHGTVRGIAHALIEVRQDLVRTDDGQRAWAERLVPAIASAVKNFEDAQSTCSVRS